MEKIAYLGLGIMGQGMAANLLKAGYPVTVWNRTPAACEPLVGQGARPRLPTICQDHHGSIMRQTTKQ